VLSKNVLLLLIIVVQQLARTEKRIVLIDHQ
jgi:hypothetical protein